MRLLLTLVLLLPCLLFPVAATPYALLCDPDGFSSVTITADDAPTGEFELVGCSRSTATFSLEVLVNNLTVLDSTVEQPIQLPRGLATGGALTVQSTVFNGTGHVSAVGYFWAANLAVAYNDVTMSGEEAGLQLTQAALHRGSIRMSELRGRNFLKVSDSTLEFFEIDVRKVSLAQTTDSFFYATAGDVALESSTVESTHVVVDDVEMQSGSAFVVVKASGGSWSQTSTTVSNVRAVNGSGCRMAEMVMFSNLKLSDANTFTLSSITTTMPMNGLRLHTQNSDDDVSSVVSIDAQDINATLQCTGGNLGRHMIAELKMAHVPLNVSIRDVTFVAHDHREDPYLSPRLAHIEYPSFEDDPNGVVPAGLTSNVTLQRTVVDMKGRSAHPLYIQVPRFGSTFRVRAQDSVWRLNDAEKSEEDVGIRVEGAPILSVEATNLTVDGAHATSVVRMQSWAELSSSTVSDTLDKNDTILVALRGEFTVIGNHSAQVLRISDQTSVDVRNAQLSITGPGSAVAIKFGGTASGSSVGRTVVLENTTVASVADGPRATLLGPWEGRITLVDVRTDTDHVAALLLTGTVASSSSGEAVCMAECSFVGTAPMTAAQFDASVCDSEVMIFRPCGSGGDSVDGTGGGSSTPQGNPAPPASPEDASPTTGLIIGIAAAVAAVGVGAAAVVFVLYRRRQAVASQQRAASDPPSPLLQPPHLCLDPAAPTTADDVLTA